MTFQDKITILVTLIAGFIVGGYLYLAGYAPTFGIPDVGKQSTYEGLVITADSYGACAATANCLAFQLLGNGSYRAIYDVTGQKIVQEGVLSKPLRTKLNFVINGSRKLEAESALLENPVCRYKNEGTNYRFNLAVATTTYKLDSCRTNINYDGAVWGVLSEVWNELSVPKQ